jgi:hypothetical protein
MDKRPVRDLTITVNYILRVGADSSVIRLPEGAYVSLVTDDSELGRVVVREVAEVINDGVINIRKLFELPTIKELRPSTLCEFITDINYRTRLLDSAFTRSLVAEVFGGWCYMDATEADRMFLERGPATGDPDKKSSLITYKRYLEAENILREVAAGGV